MDGTSPTLQNPRDVTPGASAGAWFAVAVLLALTILSYLDRSILALLVGPIEADLHIGDVQMSLLQGLAFALFYSVASVPMGWVSDHVSRRGVIFAGATIWSLATAACGLARSFGHLFWARVAVGAGEATLSPAAYALIADLFPPRRLALAVGILAAGSAIGGAIAFIVGGVVVHWAQTAPPIWGLRSWQLVFVIVGLPGLLVAPLIWLVPKPVRAATLPIDALAPAPHYGRWLTRHSRYILPLSLGTGFQCVIAYGVTGWTPSYLQRHFGYDVGTAGLVLGIVQGIGGVTGFIGGGWLVDRLSAAGVRSPHALYLIASAAGTTLVGAVAFGLVNSAPVLLAMIGLLHLLMPFTGPAVAQLQSFTPPEYRARTLALFMLIFNLLGMVVGPSSVAMFTTYIAGGPAKIGIGITIAFLVWGPLATISLLLAGRAAGRLQGSRVRDERIGAPITELAGEAE